MSLIDINVVMEQLSQMVKGCIEAARDQVTSSIAEVNIKSPEIGDIAGLREQIRENTLFLLPSIAPSVFAAKGDFTLEPKIYVVVGGFAPQFRAYSMYGYDANPTKIKVAYGVYADTVAGALNNLLQVTMYLVTMNKGEVVTGERRVVNDVGGYYRDTPKMTPEQREQEKWFATHSKISPNASFKVKTSPDTNAKPKISPDTSFNTNFTTPKTRRGERLSFSSTVSNAGSVETAFQTLDTSKAGREDSNKIKFPHLNGLNNGGGSKNTNLADYFAQHANDATNGFNLHNSFGSSTTSFGGGSTTSFDPRKGAPGSPFPDLTSFRMWAAQKRASEGALSGQ